MKMNDPPIESAKEIEALRETVAEWERGDRQYPQAVQDYKDLCVELKRTQFDLAAMTQERDVYAAANRTAYDGMTAALKQLSAAQAREKALRDAAEFTVLTGEGFTELSNALATPDDSSALDAVLKPRGWWNPKYPTLSVQLTKPHDGGGWEPFYTAPEKVTSLDLMPQAD